MSRLPASIQRKTPCLHRCSYSWSYACKKGSQLARGRRLLRTRLDLECRSVRYISARYNGSGTSPAQCVYSRAQVDNLLNRFRNWKKVPGLPYGLVHVVIKTNSACMVRGMTKSISKWEKTDFSNGRGCPSHNADLFRPLY